jgi:DNA polymerase I-like protein with 3'-5' exonuclease and polymerase domains
MDKPLACQSCVLYGDGKGFSQDELIPQATTLVLSQSPRSTDELQATHFFPLASLTRGENVSIARVIKCKQPATSVIPQEAIDHCTSNHLVIPNTITKMIAVGEVAASWCAGNKVAVHRFRGHVLYPTKPELPIVYVVEEIHKVMKDPKGWYLNELDWRKFNRLGTWPSVIPSRYIATEHNWNEVLAWIITAIQKAPYIAIDTEFVGRPFGSAQPLLTMVGLGWVDTTGGVHGLQIDTRQAQPWMKASFYKHLADLTARVPVLFQNYAADMPILKRCAGIQYDSYKQIDDQMLAHAVIYCELPHDLEFLTSIYGGYYKIKHLGDYSGMSEDAKWQSLQWLVDKGWITSTTNDTPDLLYNWGDVIEPLMIWEHLKQAFDMDKEAYNVYRSQSIALIPQLLRSMERGIKVNRPRVIQAKEEYEGRVQQAQLLAEVYYGKPINLGSDDQVGYYCYRERDYPVQISKKTKNPTVDEDAIATLREYVGPEVDTNVALTLDLALTRIDQGADPILEARVLYQEAQHALDAYIYGLVATVYNAQGESAKKKARSEAKKNGFTTDDVVERVYPNFAIHTQKNARWSTTNPPLAQLPSDLRNIIVPDDGECWPHWDWSGMELHFLECHSSSRVLKDAHDNGLDLHTWTMCKMFSYQLPPNCKVNEVFKAPENQAWRDKYNIHYSGDPRRVFSKASRFECNYGGTGSVAASRAIRMGLSKTEVQRALSNLLTADTDYYRWRQAIERQVKTTRIIRTFTGRPRRFLSIGQQHGTAVPAKVVREALDYPMQAGVADLFNLTLLKVCETYPFIILSWQMHDAMYLACPIHLLTDKVIEGLKGIATREVKVEGRIKRFPIDFGIKYGYSTTTV